MKPTRINPDARIRAFASFAALVEDIGGPDVDGSAIAGLYLAAKYVRFDGRAFRVKRRGYLHLDSIRRAQAMVTRSDANQGAAAQTAI